MSARLVWVLLLLAAVFSMHGVQCVAAHGEDGHGSTGSITAALVESAASAPVAMGHQVSGDVPRVAPLAAIAVLPHDSSTGDDAGLWAVCLAVLMTGVVLLIAVALVRREAAFLLPARAVPALWHTGWSRLPRPPDLSALCLLRI
ncbi:MAG: exported protein of unknown function [Blastococcus sp.]|nr:exported protein of unknown function [Blastococcus sp.]